MSDLVHGTGDVHVIYECLSKLLKWLSPESRRVKPELSAERFQHVRFLDCDKAVSRIIFECGHCQEGILCEFTGEPVVGEYNGRSSIIQVKVQCPNSEQTAIRVSTEEVLSTIAIPSPWT